MPGPMIVSRDELARLLASDDPATRRLAEWFQRYRQRRHAAASKYEAQPGPRAKKRERQRAYWSSEEGRTRRAEYRSRPESLERRREKYARKRKARERVVLSEADRRHRRKVRGYARAIAAERGIPFEQAMQEIGA